MLPIRPAEPADAAAIADLCGQFGYPSSPESVRERLARIAASPDHAVFVAEADGRPLAFMQVSVHHTVESGSWAEIDGLVVAEGMRGRGIGAGLIAHARAWASTRSMPRLRVRTNEKRTDARRFYERERFTLAKSQCVYDQEL